MTTKISSALILGFMFCFSTVGGGCQRSRIAASTAATANAAQPSPTKQVSSKVTRVVFVGKEHACDCTRKTVDAGWAALQKALGTPAKLPTERLLVDTQGPKVEPYRNQKPIMALPAIYFLDSKDVVLNLVQGEVAPGPNRRSPEATITRPMARLTDLATLRCSATSASSPWPAARWVWQESA